jgi:ABC-type nitrate/sulfonate/bicarbonate transport system substrate-binding protein
LEGGRFVTVVSGLRKFVLGAALLFIAHVAAAETVEIGIVKSTTVGDARIAAERGYFTQEGLWRRLP